jgi:hypothetical protein
MSPRFILVVCNPYKANHKVHFLTYTSRFPAMCKLMHALLDKNQPSSTSNSCFLFPIIWIQISSQMNICFVFPTYWTKWGLNYKSCHKHGFPNCFNSFSFIFSARWCVQMNENCDFGTSFKPHWSQRVYTQLPSPNGMVSHINDTFHSWFVTANVS